MTLTTPRLILRPWRETDREPFAALNADPEVMRFFPATFTRAESDAAVDRYQANIERLGFGFWALEIPGVAEFAGVIGIQFPRFASSFSDRLEIGWRLDRPFWGQGYATEGARACLDHAFGPLGMPEVVAFTVPTNLPSRAVMERLGMTHDPSADFEHPLVPEGNPLRRHVLYRISAPTSPSPATT